MQVGDGFAGIWPVIEDEAEAGGGEAELVGDLGGFEEEVAEELLVCGRGVGEARDGLFGDDQYVGRGLGLDVAKGQEEVVFINDGGRDFTGDDFFEEGFAHGPKSCCGKRKASM